VLRDRTDTLERADTILDTLAGRVADLDVYGSGNHAFWREASVEKVSEYIDDLEGIGNSVFDITKENLGIEIRKLGADLG